MFKFANASFSLFENNYVGWLFCRKDKFSVFPQDSVTANPKTQNNNYAFWIELAGVELQIDGTLFSKRSSCRAPENKLLFFPSPLIQWSFNVVSFVKSYGGGECWGVKAVNGQKEPIEFAWNCSFSSCLFSSLKDSTSFIIGHRCVSNMYL